ncbi:MAG: S1C family serine protease [Anaerolineae bacterium]
MSTFKELSDAMAQAVETVNPSVVQVNARRRLPATGVVWSADGVIVTANHIVQHDDNITITLADGTSHDATLIGRDPQNDLAVLKVDAQLTPASWGDDEALRVGHLALAIGRPGEQLQASLGLVSALVSSPVMGQRRGRRKGKGRSRGWQVLVDGYIQTDVVMYPGFSGGPLVAGDAQVHGINTSGFGQGVSVAVPVATIRNTVSMLQQHGKMKQGYLGVGVQTARISDAIAQELDQEIGLLVVSIEKDSPASRYGLLVGDILTALDDETTEQLDELLALLSGARVGKSVPVQIVRGGQLQTISVTIEERN